MKFVENMHIYSHHKMHLRLNKALRLRLQGSDMFRSVWDRIHSVYRGPVRTWNGTVPYGITFISGPIWYKIADAIHTGSTRSRVNTRLIHTNFVPVQTDAVPSKRCQRVKDNLRIAMPGRESMDSSITMKLNQCLNVQR